MSYTKVILMGAVTLGLLGCAHKNDYLKESQTIPPMGVPTNIYMKPSENYYPITKGITVTTPPLQEPPGSDLQRFKPVKKPAQQALTQPTVTEPVRTVQLPEAAETTKTYYASAKESLTVAGSENQVWAKVGRALQHSPYQILDQDPTMGSYYVLDAVSTGNKVTQSTPIYRVYLKSENNKTQILLLDQQNQPAASDVAVRIISMLRHELAR